MAEKAKATSANLLLDVTSKFAEEISNQIAAAGADYKNIAESNLLMKETYSELSSTTQKMIGAMVGVQDKYKEIEKLVSTIDELESKVLDVELIAKELEDYTKGVGN
ncbi:hypothetical protein HK096_007867 [Nowakowskiella sp. JEL0078]|nr:hypothetical protein HK096_007867 [Nowakowskiella sp. JEL0078]